MSDEVTMPESQEAVKEQPAQQPGPDLNMRDLDLLKRLLEVAIERAAYKAEECEVVGKIFNKLSTFINAASKKGE
jgi:Zn-dependent peptidase ImmA (M78 family)